MLNDFDHGFGMSGFACNRSLTIECPECDGEGQREYEVKEYGGPPGAYSPFKEVMLECQRCNGEGEIWPEDEDYCDE